VEARLDQRAPGLHVAAHRRVVEAARGPEGHDGSLGIVAVSFLQRGLEGPQLVGMHVVGSVSGELEG
jgi:hypothetical protein